jgi:FkbM family methyltransferase
MIQKAKLAPYKLICSLYPKFNHIKGFTRLKVTIESLTDRIVGKPITEQIKGVEITLNDFRDFEEYYSGINVIEGYEEIREIKEDDIVIDAGAYPGEFTVYAARKGSKVIALEPDDDNAADLEDNLDLNDVENVVVRSEGLSDNIGEIRMTGEKFTSEINQKGEKLVDITTLDSLVAELELEKLDFVKMDIEGAEIMALDGGEETMARFSPFFSIASYHQVDDEKSYKEVERKLSENDFKARTGFEKHRTTWGWK